MKILSIIFFAVIFLGITSCNNQNQEEANVKVADSTAVEIPLSEAEQWVADAIQAHGGEKYKTAHFQFDFRGDRYQFKNDGDNFRYQMEEITDDGAEFITHVIENDAYTFLLNNRKKELDTKQTDIYKEALNSVVYFVSLPGKLGDPAVIVDQKGETFIKDTAYQLIVVQFEKKDGGKDFEDQYLYWINHETKQVDYLAYSYKDEKGGGTRFRKAYNRRTVDGIVFQDYINYKGEPDLDLYILAEQYEKDELEELSRIETENVRSLN